MVPFLSPHPFLQKCATLKSHTAVSLLRCRGCHLTFNMLCQKSWGGHLQKLRDLSKDCAERCFLNWVQASSNTDQDFTFPKLIFWGKVAWAFTT